MTDRSLRSRAATLPARALIALAQHLPYRMRLALGSALLRGAVALVPRLRARAENNLRLIFPEMPVGERRRIRRAMADNFGRTFTEILSNPSFHGRGYWIPPEPGPGTEAILRAAREGSGAVLVTGHFGQWEAGRAWMKSSGIACAGVYRPLDEPELNAIYLENLEFGGTPIFPKSRRGVRGIVAHVARGGIVAILTDQFERRGAALDFIGHPAPTALVPAELAFRVRIPQAVMIDGDAGDIVRQDFPDRAGQQEIVGIEEHDEVAGCALEAGIEAGALALIGLLEHRDDLVAVAADHIA